MTEVFHDKLMNSAFAGKLSPMLSKLYIPPSKAKDIIKDVAQVAHFSEWMMIILIGWATVPLVKYPYNKIGYLNGNFEKTFLYHLATNIASAGKIAALVYGFDCIMIAMRTLGFHIKQNYSNVVAKAIYSCWILARLITWKRYFIEKMVCAIRKGNPEGKKNRAIIANKITDILLVGMGASFLLDILQVETGICLTSFFAVGSAGTILVSIASKDIAMAMVSGLALQASDKMFEGDTIRFGSTEGRVDHIVSACCVYM